MNKKKSFTVNNWRKEENLFNKLRKIQIITNVCKNINNNNNPITGSAKIMLVKKEEIITR